MGGKIKGLEGSKTIVEGSKLIVEGSRGNKRKKINFAFTVPYDTESILAVARKTLKNIMIIAS